MRELRPVRTVSINRGFATLRLVRSTLAAMQTDSANDIASITTSLTFFYSVLLLFQTSTTIQTGFRPVIGEKHSILAGDTFTGMLYVEPAQNINYPTTLEYCTQGIALNGNTCIPRHSPYSVNITSPTSSFLLVMHVSVV